MESKTDGLNVPKDFMDLSPSGQFLKIPNPRHRRRSSVMPKLTSSQTELLKHRRMTTSFQTELLKQRRMTRAGLSDSVEEKPKVRMENTYRMEPDDDTRFTSGKVKKEIIRTFENYLDDVKYEPDRCSKLCVELSVLVKNSVKALGFPRYKIICNVIIGQCGDQDLQMASRSVWDTKNDNFSYAVYKNASLFAVGIVHGVYYE